MLATSVGLADGLAHQVVEHRERVLPLRAEHTPAVVTGIEVALHVLAHTSILIGHLLAELHDVFHPIGVVVEEKQRLGAELQQTLRLAAASEMAGALSHELHQPLTALLAYTRACQQLLAQGESGERLRDVIDRVAAESQRAAEVVSRLRDFFRTGTTRLEQIWLRELLSSATSGFAAQAREQGVDLVLQLAPSRVEPLVALLVLPLGSRRVGRSTC